MPEQALDLDGYEAVDSTWQFDLQFYRDLGLDLGPLEDPNPEALMPRLRRVASICASLGNTATTSHVERAQKLLRRTHWQVQGAIEDAIDRLNLEDVTPEHPAVIAYCQRPVYEESKRQFEKKYIGAGNNFIPGMLTRISLIHLGLVRPKMPDIDPPYLLESKAKFVPVTNPNANYYDNPVEVAPQLALARAGVWFDL